MDLIDSAWPIANSDGDSDGDTGSGNYTTVAWVTGEGKGATFTPAGGDTAKKLLFTNSGVRYSNGDLDQYPTSGRFFSATEGNTTHAWYLLFRAAYSSGVMGTGNLKLYAHSLRCVRS